MVHSIDLCLQRGASKKAMSSEEQQMAIAAQHQFKARPINEAVFNGCGTIGVPTTVIRVAHTFKFLDLIQN